MNETRYTRETAEAALSFGIHNVCYYKLDGTLTDIRATRDINAIPADKRPIGEFARPAKTSTVVTVYDVDADIWKSFILENLVTLE
jgi:WYL_2, Sm-like SH3 beta-barrel fold